MDVTENSFCQSQHPSHGIKKAKMSHPATTGVNKRLLLIHLGLFSPLIFIIQRERFSHMSKLLLETFQQDLNLPSWVNCVSAGKGCKILWEDHRIME